MRERPSRDERRENRQEIQQAKLRVNREDNQSRSEYRETLEKYVEKREQDRNLFQKEQEAKISKSPFKMKLDSAFQIAGQVQISGWEANNHRSLVSMLTEAYKKFDAQDSKAQSKANKIYRMLSDQFGGNIISTPGTVIRISGNELRMVGATTIKNEAIETASRPAPRAAQSEQAVVINQNGQSRPYEAPRKPEPTNWEELPDGGTIEFDRTPKTEAVPEESNEAVEKPAEWEEMMLTAYRGESPVSFPIQIARTQVESGQYSYEVDGLPWGEMAESQFKRLLFQNSYYSNVIKDEGITRPNQLLLMEVEV